jgi:hypothetical protein
MGLDNHARLCLTIWAPWRIGWRLEACRSQQLQEHVAVYNFLNHEHLAQSLKQAPLCR